MGMLERLFDNPAIKNAAFAKVRQQMEDHGIKFGVFTIDENNEFDLKLCKEDTTTINVQELEELRRVYSLFITGELIENNGK
jgi:hypothetical protein